MISFIKSENINNFDSLHWWWNFVNSMNFPAQKNKSHFLNVCLHSFLNSWGNFCCCFIAVPCGEERDPIYPLNPVGQVSDKVVDRVFGLLGEGVRVSQLEVPRVDKVSEDKGQYLVEGLVNRTGASKEGVASVDTSPRRVGRFGAKQARPPGLANRLGRSPRLFTPENENTTQWITTFS